VLQQSNEIECYKHKNHFTLSLAADTVQEKKERKNKMYILRIKARSFNNNSRMQELNLFAYSEN
jgi:hypothetical protein